MLKLIKFKKLLHGSYNKMAKITKSALRQMIREVLKEELTDEHEKNLRLIWI